MSEICRTCLEIVSDTSEMCYLSDMEPNEKLFTLGQKLADCVPELVIINGVLCWPCATALRCAYGFRQQCVESEKRINSYLQRTNHNGYLDLKQVIQQRYGKDQSNMTVDVVTSGTKMSNFNQHQNSPVAHPQVIQVKVEAPTPPIVHQTLTEPGGAVVNKVQQSSVSETLKNLDVCTNFTPQLTSACNLPKMVAPPIQAAMNLNVGNIQQAPCPTTMQSNFEIKYMCNQCNYHSLIPSDLQDHLLTHKTETVTPNGRSEPTYTHVPKELLEETTYVCTEFRCTYKTSKIKRFESHQRVHLALKANV